MEEVSRRNTQTVEIALRDMISKILEQQTRIDGLTNSISTLMERQNSLEKMVYDMKIKLIGTGASKI